MIGQPSQESFAVQAQLARARARAYALLALALQPPTPQALEQLASGAAWRDFLRLCPEVGLTGQVASLVQAALPFVERVGGEVDATPAGVLYTRLFDSPGAPAPPYGSLYLEGRLMGETTLSALDAYRRAGLEPAEDLGDLPDHAAVEAEFLCEILWREMEAWERGEAGAAVRWLGEEIAFLKDHLGRWFPAFAARLVGVPESGLYGPLLRAGRSFFALDRGIAEQVLAWAGSRA